MPKTHIPNLDYISSHDLLTIAEQIVYLCVILLRESLFYPPKLVTESEKQLPTQKPDILHTSTIKTRQTTPLDHFKAVFYGGFAYAAAM